SLAMLVMLVVLVLLERYARRNQRYATAAQKPRTIAPARLAGWRAASAFGICFLPIALGFVAPAIYLCIEAWKRFRFAGISARIQDEIVNTVTVSSIATVVVLLCGLLFAYAARTYPGRLTALAARASTLGYAVPGTVLAIGLLVPVGLFDRFWVGAVERLTGAAPGLLLLGSGAALVLAYSTRFMAISTGGIEAGFSRIPP